MINALSIRNPGFSKQAVSGGGGSSQPALTDVMPALLRNDFTGLVGFKFTVGSSSITVTDLGRWIVSGNSQSHDLRIYNLSTGTLQVQVTLNTAGLISDGFGYTAITPFVLSASTDYAIVSAEVNGGDQWYNGAAFTPASAIGVVQNCYNAGGGFVLGGTDIYVPVNFKFY